MSRPLWKGSISFGLVNIPVDLYPAENRNRFDLTLLDRRDMKPVGFKRYNKVTGKEVPWDQILKGYEYEKNRYVVLIDEDFRRANVEATQTVDIVSFVKVEHIAPASFETPYYVVPDERGVKGYALLRETLTKTGKVAIAMVVIRTRQYLAAIMPWEGVLLLNTLRYANEIRPVKNLNIPTMRLKADRVTAREVEMAAKLVEDMSGDWKPLRYKDTYHEDLMGLIRKRIKAGRTEVVVMSRDEEPIARPSKGKVLDLMALLKKSVQRTGKHKRVSTSEQRQIRRKSA